MSHNEIKRRSVLALLGAGGALTACGGGGGGEGDDGPGEEPGGGISLARRDAVTKGVARRFEELARNGATPAAWNALRDWVLKQPEFDAAGVEPQGLWARFTDGRYFLYTDSWPVRPERDDLQRHRMALDRLAREQAAAAAPPGSENAMIVSMVGLGEFSDGLVPMEQMARALEERGWRVAPGRELEADTLKNRPRLGFLYVNSHSAVWGPSDREKEFAVMTETRATLANDRRFAEDLDDGSLIYHRDRTFTQIVGWEELGPPKLALTGAYFRKYVRFAPNSLAIFLSCHSGSPRALLFRQALRDAGVGTIVGWDGNSNPNSFETVTLLVDRLTGQNEIAPQTPPNRPFDMDAVWAYLGRKRKLVTPAWPGSGQADSTAERLGRGFNVLCPIIEELQVDEDDELVIHGDFGPTAGTVTIGGTPVAARWADKEIRVKLPTGPGDPPGSCGEVVVEAGNLTSNPRPLVSWRGTLSMKGEFQPGETGILSNTLRYELHLRGDGVARRDEVDGQLLPNTWNMMPASDTRASYSAGGRCTHGEDDVETWSGNGTTEHVYGPILPGEVKVGGTCRVDAVAQRLEMWPRWGDGAPGISRTRTQGNPMPTGRLMIPMRRPPFLNPRGGPRDHEPLPWGVYLPFSSTAAHIGGGSYVDRVDDTMRTTYEWTAMRALPAVTDRMAR